MIGFWILAALISGLAGLLVLLRAAAVRPSADGDPVREAHARLLREIDEDAERGLLSEEDRTAARAEAARRLIRTAEAAPPPTAAAPGRARALVLAAAIAAPLLALGVYLLTGSPQVPDQPFAGRLDAWRRASIDRLDAARIAALLEDAARAHPKDPQPLIFLARAQQAQGQPIQALHSLQRALRLAPGRADIWAALGDALADQAGGEVTPDTRRAFEQSLKLDPTTLLALYQLARADIAAGHAAEGLARWRALLAQLPAGDPRRAALEQEIAAVARSGRLPAAPIPAAAAAGQDKGEQRAFIQSMVDRFAARLKQQPEDPDGWARLIHAYGVLGETDRQQAAVAEVERRYASRPSVMRSILAQR